MTQLFVCVLATCTSCSQGWRSLHCGRTHTPCLGLGCREDSQQPGCGIWKVRVWVGRGMGRRIVAVNCVNNVRDNQCLTLQCWNSLLQSRTQSSHRAETTDTSYHPSIPSHSSRTPTPSKRWKPTSSGSPATMADVPWVSVLNIWICVGHSQDSTSSHDDHVTIKWQLYNVQIQCVFCPLEHWQPPLETQAHGASFWVFMTHKWKWCPSLLSSSPTPYTLGTLFSHSWSSSQWKGNTAYSQLLSTPASKWTQDKVFISSLDSENDNIGQVNKDEKMKAWKWGWYLDWEWGWYLDWEWGWYLEPGNEADTWTELMLKAISSAVWTNSVKMSLSEQ